MDRVDMTPLSYSAGELEVPVDELDFKNGHPKDIEVVSHAGKCVIA
jgi:hypothetical protein